MWQPVEADMGVGQRRERKNSGQVAQPKPPRQDSSGETTQVCNWLGGVRGWRVTDNGKNAKRRLERSS